MMHDYTSHVGDEHRKDFGQFFTPLPIAHFMVTWVLEGQGKEIYDPAFGLGAFHSVLPETSIRFEASELDKKVIGYWSEKSKLDNAFIKNEDYLLSWGKAYQNIVCNPPYMRFQKFLNRHDVFDVFQRNLGTRLSGYTNTASAFLLKSISELNVSGRLAYIMPLEFLNTGYGKIVKERLLAEQHLFAVISFECEKFIFPDATTSVGIVLYDRSKKYNRVRFYTMHSVDELEHFDQAAPVSEVGINELKHRDKWQPYFTEGSFAVEQAKVVPLHTYGRFSRGIATGANEYFVLSRESASALEVNQETECLRCITKSSQINKPVFMQADYDELLMSGKPVLLFSPKGSLSAGAVKYIKHGEDAEYNKRFLTRNRRPWYSTELRNPAKILLGVFSRGGYKVILNESMAVNLTCFHGYNANMVGQAYVKHLFVYLQSDAGRKIIARSMRKYGDGLDKFEPNDINHADVPSIDVLSAISDKDLEEAIESIAKNGSVPPKIELLFAQLIQHEQ